MIDFLMMALFVAQPQAQAATPGAAPSATAAPARSPTLGPVQLRNPVEISAKLVTGDRSQAVFTGDVQVKHRTMDLRCDKMTAFYTGGSQEVTRVECAGNVRAVDGDRSARGERADYDVPAGVLVVTGSPEARQGTTFMSGTKVRLALGNERLEVENAKIIVETAPAAAAAKKKPGTGGTKK